MIIDWRRKVTGNTLHRPFDAEFLVGDTFEFVFLFTSRSESLFVWKKSSKMRGIVLGAEAIKQSSKSVWGAIHDRYLSRDRRSYPPPLDGESSFVGSTNGAKVFNPADGSTAKRDQTFICCIRICHRKALHRRLSVGNPLASKQHIQVHLELAPLHRLPTARTSGNSR